MSIDTCHLNFKLNFILSSTVIKKKCCDSITIYFLLLPRMISKQKPDETNSLRTEEMK